ncbi:unnamed protein product [Microthlaspi erraticum]|uniref:Thioredoxin domain-containing protein n=1 Tax=Microthlaspi erraticum TaxID=1685480 RepID=A0A6D2IHK9_9BRAS|nr:unnamed protein product [Microthlaspi erraticum]
MDGEGDVIDCHFPDDCKEKIKAANESKKLVVIDFTASWAPPCREIAPAFVEMAKKFLNAVFFKVDVDELREIAEEFNNEAMPTFVFMKDGKIIDRVMGAKKEVIQETLMKHGGVAV